MEKIELSWYGYIVRMYVVYVIVQKVIQAGNMNKRRTKMKEPREDSRWYNYL